ncbi:DUF7171 family protein [Rhodococcoides fascians]|uniref:DUF7171 family protein n=1 Tax=Rhodococcoides fascians TaxID=1828 RepID=UPI0005672644|nr:MULTISPECIES: hypothetical protein [Rhodococcus]OZE98104.1 hypothetical protein CH301_17325 [Rhodococcus sp. 15-1189-1-1a]OZF12754.1 hypothetical protein CH299_18010 [Rhodococcus sp. 14-2686-1-2]
MSQQPLIDSARLKFSGMSAEDFEDVPEIGEQRTYTILATCQAHTEQAMANEGTRKSVNMKVVRVLSGVTEEINKPEDPSLFDQDEDGDEPTDPDEVDEPEDPDEPEAEPSNVTKLANPAFSSQD